MLSLQHLPERKPNLLVRSWLYWNSESLVNTICISTSLIMDKIEIPLYAWWRCRLDFCFHNTYDTFLDSFLIPVFPHEIAKPVFKFGEYACYLKSSASISKDALLLFNHLIVSLTSSSIVSLLFTLRERLVMIRDILEYVVFLQTSSSKCCQG